MRSAQQPLTENSGKRPDIEKQGVAGAMTLISSALRSSALGMPVALVVLFTFFLAPCSQAEDNEVRQTVSLSATEDLRKQAQNPVANLISVPFHNNTDYNTGPFARDKNTLNIQPVIPHLLGESVMLISRVNTSIVYSPDYSQHHLGTFGVGDISPTFFFVPSKLGKLIGVRDRLFVLPTASDNNLGSGKFCIGPSVVALVQAGHWTLGALVSNIWSVAGSSSRPDMNTFSLQYFVNYDLQKGWFLTSAPNLSANWNASSGNVWLVPFGGGFGRVFRVGVQPMNGSLSAYYNAERPQPISPTLQLRAQLALLFPRMPKSPK